VAMIDIKEEPTNPMANIVEDR